MKATIKKTSISASTLENLKKENKDLIFVGGNTATYQNWQEASYKKIRVSCDLMRKVCKKVGINNENGEELEKLFSIQPISMTAYTNDIGSGKNGVYTYTKLELIFTLEDLCHYAKWQIAWLQVKSSDFEPRHQFKMEETTTVDENHNLMFQPTGFFGCLINIVIPKDVYVKDLQQKVLSEDIGISEDGDLISIPGTYDKVFNTFTVLKDGEHLLYRQAFGGLDTNTSGCSFPIVEDNKGILYYRRGYQKTQGCTWVVVEKGWSGYEHCKKESIFYEDVQIHFPENLDLEKTDEDSFVAQIKKYACNSDRILISDSRKTKISRANVYLTKHGPKTEIKILPCKNSQPYPKYCLAALKLSFNPDKDYGIASTENSSTVWEKTVSAGNGHGSRQRTIFFLVDQNGYFQKNQQEESFQFNGENFSLVAPAGSGA